MSKKTSTDTSMQKVAGKSNGAQARLSAGLLTCRVGEQWLGLLVMQVREVISPLPCTPMPLAGEAVLGLINLRGRVITQLDMRRILDIGSGASQAFRLAIVETASGEDFALVIDEVGEVVEMQADCYEKTPDTLADGWHQISDGVLNLGQRVIVLVDVERLISKTMTQHSDAGLLHDIDGRRKA